MKRLFMLASYLIFMASCTTPLSQSAIDRVTVCKGVAIDKVRKNLLLAGFNVTSFSNTHLATDYKQVTGGSGPSRILKRVTVVEISKDLLKFKVRLRSESYQSISTGMVTHQSVDHQGELQTTTMDNSQFVPTTNEYDERYVEESLKKYRAFQRLVCKK